MYADAIRPQVEVPHAGQFLVLDVVSGDYQIAENDAEASLALLARRPEAILFGVRIGDEVAYDIGSGTTT
jgi:hypothetical protein